MGKVELTKDDLVLFLNNCFANIFVTDGSGDIIFVNRQVADDLCVTEDYLLARNIYDLLEEGITSYSSTDNTIKTRKRTVATYTNRDGMEIMTVTTPVFDDKGNLIFCVTHSRKTTDMDLFLDQIREERAKSARYQDAIEYLDNNKKTGNTIIYRSMIMDSLCKAAQLIAPTNSTVMLYGESGVGKEVFANYIHSHSDRKNEIFIPVNCAAIPANLMETELFGYVRGAFTGARSQGKAGLFEVVNHGTIFLDEIGELSLEMQSKLLRVLENGEFRRVGSEKILNTDARIIGATNRDLQKMVKERLFREDLYYRINVLPFEIPPLRDRQMDVIALAEYFLARYNKKNYKHLTLDPKMYDCLKEYSWPGNVRELRNIIERYVVTENPFVIRSLGLDVGERRPAMVQDVITPLKEKMNQLELQYINHVLEVNGGSVQKAADQLGVHRSLIYRKLKETEK